MAKSKTKTPPADAAEAAQIATPQTGQTFEHEGKTYELVIPALNIPEIGKRTALEIAFDDEVHEALGNKTIKAYLVDVKSGAIKEKK
ncbi:MAG: hypothetical protein RLZZ420_1256 [Bacteroidota bacterium]|jgi:hypothetical protein